MPYRTQSSDTLSYRTGQRTTSCLNQLAGVLTYIDVVSSKLSDLEVVDELVVLDVSHVRDGWLVSDFQRSVRSVDPFHEGVSVDCVSLLEDVEEFVVADVVPLLDELDVDRIPIKYCIHAPIIVVLRFVGVDEMPLIEFTVNTHTRCCYLFRVIPIKFLVVARETLLPLLNEIFRYLNR